ncbi:glycoside hydrolase family 15 protein [Pontibacter diazotrophicus]|uniref:Glycoside hydrolase family 15 protein n=1 Tax=Pontibacter diazotrophicus TaxID=1400979 RepID=A0A3D8LGZ3_9BACT|nr:glycoside hydrolase family 15 protein [Pontibacter diazotrophicus]RDV16606.1 glycoside hydrolase family 15 protein [Pontibacter diazotrophicus]
MTEQFTPLQDLALIGDRRTCALLDKRGSIVWYCPKRFDNPSLFASLLDPQKGGSWTLEIEGLEFKERAYLEDSGILQTHFSGEKGKLLLEDWMPLYARFYGICRTLSPSPVPYRMLLSPRPNYARQSPVLEQKEEKQATLDFDFHLYASHPLAVEQDTISCQVPAGEEAWFILAEKALDKPKEMLEEVRELSLKNWREIASHITYKGPYEEEVRKSLRLLRMLTYAENGGIIAAATTSLPEVIGGERNYDYRYVWLRDAAMIVSALARAGSDGEEERKFLSFMCSAMHRIPAPVVPMLTLDTQPVGTQQALNFRGYKNSQPVEYGNGASDQLQLDANSNVLIAAKVIYNRYNTREHWETIQGLANFLVAHWQEPDHGIWEETPIAQYTSSKVIASISLKYIAEHSTDEDEKKRWQDTSEEIKAYVEENCITSEGAYAVYAGSEQVDVSAILFPIWGFNDADSEAMLKTIEVLERENCQDHLYRRHLVEFDSSKEGAFLAGTLWVAQYWVMRRDWDKVEAILAAALRFMNDMGIMPEEGDPVTGEWLGNLPQTFVHASLIGTVIDYKNARYGEEE